MDKQKIKDFFDKCASSWDDEMIKNEAVVATILDNAGVSSGISVLDVACGTGVLFDNYFDREVSHITGIDISEQMIQMARKNLAKKSPSDREKVTLLVADAETFDEIKDSENGAKCKEYDVVMVYNAFPHFPNQKKLIEALSNLLKKGGRLSVAHGMSREKIMEHHKGSAKDVSLDLIEAKELAQMMSEFLEVSIVISNDDMYQVVGVKN